MPSQPEAQGDILKEFREGTFLSSLDTYSAAVDITLAKRYTYATDQLHNVILRGRDTSPDRRYSPRILAS